MSPTRAELLATVEKSPIATAAHDRAGWVGLFTEDGRVEDPVGSGVHSGHREIGRFYDTFIRPRQISFHRDLDIVTGTTVIRDLTLEAAMTPDLLLMVPTVMRYDLQAGESGWQIARLRAYWELPDMVAQFLRTGMKSLRPSLRLSGALLRNQGLSKTLNYVAGFRSAGRCGKSLVEQALAEGRLTDQLPECQCDKVIAAGHTVVASIMTPSGRGVVFAELDARGRKVSDVSVFRDQV